MEQRQAAPYPEAMDHPAQRSSVTLRELLVTFYKDRRKIAAAFAIPLLLAVAVSFLPKPSYEASASLLARLGHEYLYRPQTGEDNAQPIAFDRAQLLQSEVEILTSRDLIEQVVAQIGATHLYPALAGDGSDAKGTPEQRATVLVQKKLSAVLLKDSNVIKIEFQHSDPQLAADFINRLIAAYFDKRRTLFQDPRAAFLQDQVESLRQRLNEADARLEAFSRENDIHSLPDQRSLLLNQRAGLENQANATRNNLTGLDEKIASLDRSVAAMQPEVPLYTETVRNEAIDNARKTLLDLQLKEQEILSKYTPAAPAVADVRRDIARTRGYLRELEQQHRDTVRTGRNDVRAAMQAELARLQADRRSDEASLGVLGQQLADIDRQLVQLGQREFELGRLDRERKVLAESYQTFSRRLDEARILEDMDRQEKANIRLIAPAQPPVEKKNLQPVIIGLGIVLSLTCALAVAFLSELLRSTFLTPDKLERATGLPVLVAFPVLDGDGRRAAR